jgi:hypothetical protein
MQSVLIKNTGYHQLLKLLRYMTVTLSLTSVPNILRLHIYILKKKYGPIFSCDAERIFSEYMNTLVINVRESLFKKSDAPHND